MRLLLPFGVVLLFTLAVKSQYEYDCRRMEDCKNGGTCVEFNCTCTGTFGGYNCGYDTALVDACTADPNPCQNGGTCYNDGTADLCACAYGFFGKVCENKAIEITCEGGSVDFSLTFPDDFIGVVNLGDSPECLMTETEDTVQKLKSYTLTVDISGQETGCNMTNVETTTNPETGASEFSALFQVNYLPMMTTALDELYNLTCSHEKADIQLTESFPNVGVVNENLTVSEFDETYSPVELAVLDAQGKPLTVDSQLYVGDIFQLHVYLTDETAFDDVLIERCTTNNTLMNSDEKTFVVLDKGCPTKLSKRLTKGQEEKMYDTTAPDGTAVQTSGKVLSIEAFKFVDSSNMGIVCSAKVCKSDDMTCKVPPNCDDIMNQKPVSSTETGGATATTAAESPPSETPTETPAETPAATAAETPAETPTETPVETPAETPAETPTETPTEPPTGAPAARRKRRAVTDGKLDTEEEKIVSTVLTILGPNDYRSSRMSATEHVHSLEKCLAHEEITAVVSVLGTTVCALLIACFILSCLMIKRRAKGPSFKPMFEPTPEKFRIPRAHINDSFSLGEI